MDIAIINGPNLNILGVRQPNIYGSQSFEDYFELLKREFEGVQFTYFQSNSEGAIIDYLQGVPNTVAGIVLNAGAYTHTSIAIADAIAARSLPVIEVHITNIFCRESFRTTSVIAPYCSGIIAGFGLMSYKLAVQSIVAL